MQSQKIKKTKRTLTIFGAILVSILFISTVTAVPQVNSKPLMEKINENEKNLEKARTLLESSDDPLNEDSSFLLNLLISILMRILEKYINVDVLNNILNSLKNGQADTNLANTILNILRGIFENNNILNDGPNNRNILNIVGTILKTIMTIIASLLKIFINAVIGIVGGLLRIIGAIITIIFLLLAGTQTILTLGAILMLFYAVLSKLGIKALSIIGAPIFALIASLLSISFGTVFAGLSSTLFSILAVILLFAIPIVIGLGIYYFMGDNIDGNDDEGLGFDIDFDRTGLIYMILSILKNSNTE
jgi:hypothetical protein